jgi:hypothetical protein
MNPPVSSPAIKVVKSVREQVTAEEWQARVDLAACYRLTAMYGMTEMVANHISCRVPGTTDQFLINAYGMLYEEIDASSLIKVDVEGNTLLNASDYDVNVAGFVIHSAIHMAKHDMDCVRIRTRRPAWPSRPWNAGCCRWRKPRCGFSTSPTTTSKASPTMSTSASVW